MAWNEWRFVVPVSDAVSNVVPNVTQVEVGQRDACPEPAFVQHHATFWYAPIHQFPSITASADVAAPNPEAAVSAAIFTASEKCAVPGMCEKRMEPQRRRPRPVHFPPSSSAMSLRSNVPGPTSARSLAATFATRSRSSR